MKSGMQRLALILFAWTHWAAFASAADFDSELAAIIHDYDAASYHLSGDNAKVNAYDAVAQRAARLAKQFPNRAEPLIWKGQAQASQSAADRSLSLAKQARKTLETALAMTPNAYAVEGYTTLGAMYANIPGFPLAFGDKKKARECYQNALAINPASIRANLNYAQLLFKQDDYANALKHATAALNAPPRLGRERDDQAARVSAQSLIAKAKEKLRS